MTRPCSTCSADGRYADTSYVWHIQKPLPIVRQSSVFILVFWIYQLFGWREVWVTGTGNLRFLLPRILFPRKCLCTKHFFKENEQETVILAKFFYLFGFLKHQIKNITYITNVKYKILCCLIPILGYFDVNIPNLNLAPCNRSSFIQNSRN